MTELRLRLPGVVSWRRPRRRGAFVAYPQEYLDGRMAWGAAVQAQVHLAQWQATKGPATEVEAEIVSAGRMDLDRVVTAICDALQNGQAIADDCYVRRLVVTRYEPARGQKAMTYVTVRPFAGGLVAPERDQS